jgi:hypothetical protein
MLEPNNILISSIDFQIKIIDCVSFPEHLEDDIVSWLKHQPSVLGDGTHDIFYAYSTDFENEPDLNFVIEISSINQNEMVNILRNQTGHGLFTCKKTLKEHNYNFEDALKYLQEKFIPKTLINVRSSFEILSIYYENSHKSQIYQHCKVIYNGEVIYKLDYDSQQDLISAKHFINGYCVALGLGSPIIEYKHETFN